MSYVGGDLTAEFGPEHIDVTQLQFEAARFDAILCSHVLEHVHRQAMRELARVLKPGGWALLQVPDVAAEVTDEDPSITDPDEGFTGSGDMTTSGAMAGTTSTAYETRGSRSPWNGLKTIFPKRLSNGADYEGTARWSLSSSAAVDSCSHVSTAARRRPR